jgi:hypothetical protein
MADKVNIEELRARLERDELTGEELVTALMLIMGYSRELAELIASEDYLPRTEGDVDVIS